MAKMELFFRFIKHGLLAQYFLARQANRAGDLLAGVAEAMLSPELRTRLTAEIYGARGTYKLDEMFKWEEEWFASDLPPAPAKVLVGGAGSGREVKHLVKRNYQVVAFDPAESFVRNARPRLRHPGCLGLYRGSYEELARDCRNGGEGSLKPVFEQAPYDAVVLGWGSFTHVNSSQARLGLLQCLYALCPRGPVLLSFWMRTEDSELRKSRAWALGFRIGSMLAGRKANHAAVDPGDFFLGNCGFGHYFTLAEFEQLAREAGYEIAQAPGGKYSGTFPHATLVPGKAT